MLAHYGARNIGKRGRQKQEKIKIMENLLLELQGILEKVNKKALSFEKNANADKVKQTIKKNTVKF